MILELTKEETERLLVEKDQSIEALTTNNKESRKRLLRTQEKINEAHPSFKDDSAYGTAQKLIARITQLETLLKEHGVRIPEWE